MNKKGLAPLVMLGVIIFFAMVAYNADRIKSVVDNSDEIAEYLSPGQPDPLTTEQLAKGALTAGQQTVLIPIWILLVLAAIIIIKG